MSSSVPPIDRANLVRAWELMSGRVAGATTAPVPGESSVASVLEETSEESVGVADDCKEEDLTDVLPKAVPWAVDGFPWPAEPLARHPSDDLSDAESFDAVEREMEEPSHRATWADVGSPTADLCRADEPILSAESDSEADEMEEEGWACGACTFINVPRALVCAMCETRAPRRTGTMCCVKRSRTKKIQFSDLTAKAYEAEAAVESERLASSASGGLDVVFIIDITASMGSQIEGVKRMVRRYCEQHGGEAAVSAGIRIHIVTYTENSSQGYTSHYTSSSASGLADYVSCLQHSHPPSHPKVSNANGGDGEENILHALAALYKEEPNGRIRLPLDRRLLCFVITDAPPHYSTQTTEEAKCERSALHALGMADGDGRVDMYKVLDRVLDQREGRMVFVPIMYGVRGKDLHFYAQAAMLTQGMVLRAESTDSDTLASSLANIVTMVQELQAGGDVHIPESLGGFNAVRIDNLQEASTEDDPRVPPSEVASDVKSALAGLLDSVREMGNRRWGARAAPEAESSDDEEENADVQDSKIKPMDINNSIVHWTASSVASPTGGALLTLTEKGAHEHGHIQAALPAPGMQIHLSALSLSGVDPSLGSSPHPVVCMELQAAISEERRNSLDIVLAIDVSFSMHAVMTQLKETVQQVHSTLFSTDRIAIVTFSRTAQLLLPLTCKAEIENWLGILDSIKAQTSTNIEDALRTALSLLAPQSDILPEEQFEDTDCRSRCLVLLSDGMPNVGRRQPDRLCRLTKRLSKGKNVTIHALGFTEEHDVTLMSALPRMGSGPQGGYYYLGTSEDIPAAVGDCLGGLGATVCKDISVSALIKERTDSMCCWYGVAESSSADGAPLLELHSGKIAIKCLRASERQVRLLVLSEGTEAVDLQMSWWSGGQSHEAVVSVSISDACATTMQLPSGVPPPRMNAIRVISHVVRMQVAAALTVLAGGVADIGDRYNDLQNAVIMCLAALETAEVEQEEDAVFLEGMLQALERDLGEALADRRGVASVEERGLLLSFAQEHLAMQSASSLTRCRVAYASKEQVQLRLRFLQASAGLHQGCGKESVPVDEPGLSETEIACRRECEEHACFVTLGTWRECVMGLGLFVHPRTVRERRRNLPPEVDLVVDYVSADAYNLGVRSVMQRAPVELPVDGSEDEAEEEDEQRHVAVTREDVLTSSARKRINAWLPLYINSENWHVSKTFAPSAFSLIATQLNAAFRPSDALKVCCRLMCCIVVGFVHPAKDTFPADQKRARASERAVQMYCDVHRLFHAMAEMYPEIKETALQEVRGFISDPAKRTRQSTPNLGDLVSYLSILDEVSWHDLAPTFVPEMVRRAATRFREPFDAGRCATPQALIERFDELEPEHGHVILFNKVFCAEVARPSRPWNAEGDMKKGDVGTSVTCAAVCEMYDRCWGQLPEKKATALLRDLEAIGKLNSVTLVLRKLLPCAFSDEDVCELILWADKNAGNRKPLFSTPDPSCMPRVLLSEWKRCAEFRALMEQEAQEIARTGLDSADSLQRLFAKASELECRLEAPAEHPKYRFGSREEACKIAAIARASAEARHTEMAEKGSCKGKGKGKDGGKGKSLEPLKSASEWWDEREAREFAEANPEPFDLNVRMSISSEPDDKPWHLVLRGVSYVKEGGQLTTGRDLRDLIASETGHPPGQLRIRVCHQDENTAGIGLSAILAHHRCKLEQGVEVHTKHRGGRKSGCGWHKNPPGKAPYVVGIASAMVRELVFAHAAQYHTRVDDGHRFELMLQLASTLSEHAIVVCNSLGSASALLLKLRSIGGMQERPFSVRLAGCLLTLVAEQDDDLDPNDDHTPLVDDNGAGLGASSLQGSLPKPRKVAVPDDAKGCRLVIVYDALHEAASLGSILWAVRHPGDKVGQGVTVFHIISRDLSVLLETADEQREVDLRLNKDGSLQESLSLRDQNIPTGVALVQNDCDAILPRVLDFRLRVPALGFVVRLKQRYGCRVPEVLYGALCTVLPPANGKPCLLEKA